MTLPTHLLNLPQAALSMPALTDEDAQLLEAAKTTEPAESKKKKKEKAPDPTGDHGIIFYSDGSARPTNPGFGGMGFHGYRYEDVLPKKGMGHTSQVPTARGYVPKSTAKANNIPEVKPLAFYDGYATLPPVQDINHIEQQAVQACLNHAWQVHKTQPIKQLEIWSDSKNTVDGTAFLPQWKANGWVRNNGNPLKNKETWENIDHLVNMFKDDGVTVRVTWLEGHNVHMGNNIADVYASVGSRQSMEGECRQVMVTTPPDGYWSDKYERHPFVFHKYIYFNTREGTHVPGQYFLGGQGKDVELIGKRHADGRYSAVILKQPEPYIETMIERVKALAGRYEALMLGDMAVLFEKQNIKYLDRFGLACFYAPNKGRLDVNLLGKQTLLKELTPPRKAFSALFDLNTLMGVLRAWAAGDTNFTTTDITQELYDTTDKGLILRSEFVVGRTDLPVTVKYCKKALQSETAEELEVKLDLTMGIDSLDRNAFKNMEKQNVQVKVLTWMESEKTIRFATVVLLNEDIGIWSGVHSNMVLL